MSSFYKLNSSQVYLQDFLPLPPPDGMFAKINHYGDVPEPKFDPQIHLDLHHPEYVRLLPDFKKSHATPKVKCSNGSPFAYSAPFQVLSKEGVEVIREIVLRNEGSANPPWTSRGDKYGLRGLYYLSPFIRDFQNCPELIYHFNQLSGEELLPHFTFSSVPQVNLSVCGGTDRPLDPWHWDSVAYTGVILLNDMENFEGGELELMKMNKHQAMIELTKENIVSGVHSDIISYENPGKMIFAQGSEVLHHVTPVKQGTRRISMIMAYTSANCFQNPKSVLQTMRRTDRIHQLADYEYFREKAWQFSHALQAHAKFVKYSPNGSDLAPYLRSVADELNHSADILDSKIDDSIDFFDESTKQVKQDFILLHEAKDNELPKQINGH